MAACPAIFSRNSLKLLRRTSGQPQTARAVFSGQSAKVFSWSQSWNKPEVFKLQTSQLVYGRVFFKIDHAVFNGVQSEALEIKLPK